MPFGRIARRAREGARRIDGSTDVRFMYALRSSNRSPTRDDGPLVQRLMRNNAADSLRH
jgi:hypothetical protein